jgi:plastocyanin
MFSMRARYPPMRQKQGGGEGSTPRGVLPAMTRLLTSVTVLVAAGALVAGCGGGDSSNSAGGGGAYGGGSVPAKTTATTAAAAPASGSGASALTLAADESSGLAFDPKSLSAKAGSVTITMDNPSADSLPHAIAVEGPGGVQSAGETAQPGATSKVTLDLKPGKYTFYCPVGSHRANGMEGTLTVR